MMVVTHMDQIIGRFELKRFYVLLQPKHEWEVVSEESVPNIRKRRVDKK